MKEILAETRRIEKLFTLCLFRRAVEEILAETRRIEKRVEDGTGTWHKPKFNGFNKYTLFFVCMLDLDFV